MLYSQIYGQDSVRNYSLFFSKRGVPNTWGVFLSFSWTQLFWYKRQGLVVKDKAAQEKKVLRQQLEGMPHIPSSQTSFRFASDNRNFAWCCVPFSSAFAADTTNILQLCLSNPVIILAYGGSAHGTSCPTSSATILYLLLSNKGSSYRNHIVCGTFLEK